MSHFQETFGRTRYGNLWNLWKPEKLYLCHARKALIKPKLKYRFHGFWVSKFQETWKLVKTSKNPESILTFCWWVARTWFWLIPSTLSIDHLHLWALQMGASWTICLQNPITAWLCHNHNFEIGLHRCWMLSGLNCLPLRFIICEGIAGHNCSQMPRYPDCLSLVWYIEFDFWGKYWDHPIW